MEKQVDFGAAMKPKSKGKSKFLTPVDHPYDLVPIKHKIMLYSKEIDKMVDQIGVIDVTDDGTNKAAVEIGSKAKDLWKRIEEARKLETDEPNKFVREVNRFAKMFQDRLKSIENAAKRKIADYQYHKELERREAERKAQEEAQKLQDELDKEAKEKGVESVKVGEMVMPESEKVTRTEAGSSHQRMHWTFEIVNLPELIEAAAKDKDLQKFLMGDKSSLGQAVGMGIREIPGVKIFEKASTVFRT